MEDLAGFGSSRGGGGNWSTPAHHASTRRHVSTGAANTSEQGETTGEAVARLAQRWPPQRRGSRRAEGTLAVPLHDHHERLCFAVPKYNHPEIPSRHFNS